MFTEQQLIRRRKVAEGRGKADLIIRDARVPSFTTGKIIKSDIVVYDGIITGVFEDLTVVERKGVRVINAKGKHALPGFVNSHMHLESGLLTPQNADPILLKRGTTHVIADAHEAANVKGKEAVKYFFNSARHMVMNAVMQNSASVPATPFETTGATFTSNDMAKLLSDKMSGSLAEVMNIDDPDLYKKILLFHGRGKPIDGHMPGMSGRILNVQRVLGVRNDHEAIHARDGWEKLLKIGHLLIREGTIAQNGSTAPKGEQPLFTLINKQTAPHLSFCTDDRKPNDIVREGDIDNIIRRAIQSHHDPIDVYRIATLSAANHFRLEGYGEILAGNQADIVLLDDFRACAVGNVIKDGKVVDAELLGKRKIIKPIGYNSLKYRNLTADDFKIHASDGPMDVIGLVPGSLISEDQQHDLPRARGEFLRALDKDIVKLAVIERYGKNGNIGRGFVRGLGLKICAIASSVAHDHHNVMVAGTNDGDMAIAANRLKEMGGGFCIVRNGKVIAELALPVMGLMSDQPAHIVIPILDRLNATLKEVCPVPGGFMHLSFLGLCVIPTLKLTDQGLTRMDANGIRLIRNGQGQRLAA